MCRGGGRVSGKESEVCQLVSVRSVFPVKENPRATDSLWIGPFRREGGSRCRTPWLWLLFFFLNETTQTWTLQGMKGGREDCTPDTNLQRLHAAWAGSNCTTLGILADLLLPKHCSFLQEIQARVDLRGLGSLRNCLGPRSADLAHHASVSENKPCDVLLPVAPGPSQHLKSQCFKTQIISL